MNGLRFVDSPQMINDDNFFGLDLFSRTRTLCYTSQVCYHYRIAFGSISHPQSYALNGDKNLYETYYLNAFFIKGLLAKYPLYSKILRFNVKWNANAFVAMSANLGIYDKKRIDEIYPFLDLKYKIFVHCPKLFAYLKKIKAAIESCKTRTKIL